MANSDLGDYYSMSTLSPIADYGKSLQKRAAVERALKNRLPISVGSGVMYDPSSRESSVSKEYQDQLAAKRQHEMDLANAKLQRQSDTATTKRQQKLADDKLKRQQQIEDRNYKAKQKLKPSTKSASDMAAMQASINEGSDILAQLDKNPDAIEQYWDIIPNVARWAGADTVGNIVESGLKTPEELSVKQRLNTYTAKLRHQLSGAALTKLESSLGSQYLAGNSGLSQAQARERLRNLVKYMEGELNLNKERYGIEQTNLDPQGGVNPQVQPPGQNGGLMGMDDAALDAAIAELEGKL